MIDFENPPSPDTIEQVAAIARTYVPDFFTPNFPDDLRTDMPFHRALCLRRDGALVSCLIYTCLDGSPHVLLMVTRRGDAGRGYGKELMRVFVDHVSNMGFRSVELFAWSPETRPACAATVGFYRGAGFKVTGEYNDLWGPGTKVLKLRLEW